MEAACITEGQVRRAVVGPREHHKVVPATRCLEMIGEQREGCGNAAALRGIRDWARAVRQPRPQLTAWFDLDMALPPAGLGLMRRSRVPPVQLLEQRITLRERIVHPEHIDMHAGAFERLDEPVHMRRRRHANVLYPKSKEGCTSMSVAQPSTGMAGNATVSIQEEKVVRNFHALF